jgi:hypothetical protein
VRIVGTLVAGGVILVLACSKRPDSALPLPSSEAPLGSAPHADADAGTATSPDAARRLPSNPSASADATARDEAGPRWLAQPFEGLPPPSHDAREVVVRFEVARRVHKQDGPTSPLLLVIPALRLEREIYDDRVSRPRCSSEENASANAVSLSCSSLDGNVRARAWQDGAELVVEVDGRGDVVPTMRGPHRFALPPSTRIKFEMRLASAPPGK